MKQQLGSKRWCTEEIYCWRRYRVLWLISRSRNFAHAVVHPANL
ncbi:hypothetical protein QTP86_013958 [Hemibagrus guttatus]|nr:hypothetical protein QTP86_013958 [Hemibagrus guttatus]